MFDTIITVSTKGQLVIPWDMRASLGIKPGTRISVSLDDGRIILRPLSERLVDETLGMLKGKQSMTTELQKERRGERW